MSFSEKYLAIVNPAAGGGKCGREASRWLERLRGEGFSIDVRETSAPGEAARVAREGIRSGYRQFLSLGGDGTAFEIINGIFPLPENFEGYPAIGFIPLGTGNSLLKDFSGSGAESTASAMKAGKKRRLDVVRVDHAAGVFHFINLLCFGFVAEVNEMRQRRFRRAGEFGYVLSVLARLLALHSTNVSMYDGDSVDLSEPCTFVSISNSKYTGGKMMMAPMADPSDGLVDVIFVRPVGRFRLLRAFPRIFSGKHVNLPFVISKRVRELRFRTGAAYNIMVDGESLRVSPTRLSVLSQVLEAYA